MRIYCLCCKKHILDTTEAFICGGPYNGTMFISSQGMPPYSKYPRHETIKGRNLQCPWCSAPFLGVKDELLTEHGKIKAGQKTYDPNFNIVWQEGPAVGKLMYIKDALLKVETKEDLARNIDMQLADSAKTALANEIFKDIPEILSKSVEKRIEIQSEGDPRKLKVYELKEKGLNNQQIAKEVGVSGVTVGKWLKERK